MDGRFVIRKNELVKDSGITRSGSEGVLERLASFAEPLPELMPRSEPGGHLRTYLGGLISGVERKNIKAIPYRHDQNRMNLQRFIGWGAWEHDPLMTELARQELALEMVKKKRKLLLHNWITGDAERGRSRRFHKALRDRNERHFLNVPSNTNIRNLVAAPPPWGGHGPRLKCKFERVET